MDLRSGERHRVGGLRRGRGQVERLRRRLALRRRLVPEREADRGEADRGEAERRA